MALPRGRRWVDRPRKANPTTAEKLRAAVAAGFAANDPIPDMLAYRDQVHRAADACSRRQGELPLADPPPSEASE